MLLKVKKLMYTHDWRLWILGFRRSATAVQKQPASGRIRVVDGWGFILLTKTLAVEITDISFSTTSFEFINTSLHFTPYVFPETPILSENCMVTLESVDITCVPLTNFRIVGFTLVLGNYRALQLARWILMFKGIYYNTLMSKNIDCLKMGFTAASSTSLCLSHLNTNHLRLDRFGKTPSVGGNQKLTVNFKIPDIYGKAQSTRPVCCKFEGIDFDERTSPAEVHLMSVHLFYAESWYLFFF